MSTKSMFCLAAILSAACGAANADTTAFSMSLPKVDGTVQPLIIGGVKADPVDWPMTFVFLDPTGGGCTSTAVGERAIITAAHCIANNARGSVTVGGHSIATACTHHPDYRSFPSLTPATEPVVSPDFALCSLEHPLPAGLFEHIDTKGQSIAPGNSVHLLGFGCNSVGGHDGSFGVLFEGDARIVSTPTATSYYTRALGGAAVCFGDSGGGAFHIGDSAGARRWLIGINSRGDISKLSFISTTSKVKFVEWAESWANTHATRICGLHADAVGCRPQ